MTQRQQQSQESKILMFRRFVFVPIAACILIIQAFNHIEARIEASKRLKIINSVNISPDGKLLASASYDKTVKLWDISTGKQIETLKGHSDSVNSVSFSPDGKIIASASSDKTIKLWNREGKLLRTLKGNNAKFTNLIFCPNGQEMVTAGTDNTVRLWSANGKLLKTFTGYRSLINGLDCSPDSKIIGAASKDGTVKLWSRDGQELNTLNIKKLLSSYTNENKVTTDIEQKIEELSINAYASDEIILKRLLEEPVVTQKMHFAKLTHIATHDASFMSVDGNITAYAKGKQVYIHTKSGLKYTMLHNEQVSSIGLHSKSNRMVTGCEDGTLHLWDLNNGKSLHRVKAHDSTIRKINYSGNGEIIISQSNTSITRRWNSDLSSNETNFIVVIFVLFFGFFVSAISLFVVIKRRQNRRHNNTSNPKSSYIITGWVIEIFPEDWIANLNTLRYELIATNKPKWYVRLITVTTLLDMLCGGIRVKLQDLYDGDDLMAAIGRRSTNDDRDNSMDE